ncbi:hypothetical protein, partial [Acinetobacter baumannii]|uniref:hypothetical protein n=1 Tax=Acinetobacter baumannii TaxID=470 RepID=UPI001C0702F4
MIVLDQCATVKNIEQSDDLASITQSENLAFRHSWTVQLVLKMLIKIKMLEYAIWLGFVVNSLLRT